MIFPIHPQNSFIPFLKAQLEESIPLIIERQVVRCPESIAVKEGQVSLTYQELNLAANQVAHALMESSLKPRQPVALLFNHNVAMVAAIMGTLKGGGFYLPLDPTHPKNRNISLIEEVEAQIILTDSEGLEIAKSYCLGDIQLINLDELHSSEEVENPKIWLTPDAPACILFTSGSTGKPKGVIWDQRAILHWVMLYTNDFHICEADHLSLIQLYIFVASLREIFGSLLTGAGLYLYNIRKEGIHHLARWLIDEGITIFFTVPTTFRVFLGTLSHETFDCLRMLRLGGEQVQPRDVEAYRHHFSPDCLLAINLVMTETGTICQYFLDKQSKILDNPIPVGYPVEDLDVHLLDENDAPVEDGKVGEIVVDSAYLGPGYFSADYQNQNSPSMLTSLQVRRFHTGDLGFLTKNGMITLVGRKDWVVKVRGQRVNLAEIEQALLTLDEVAEAAALLYSRPENPSYLVAFIRPTQQPPPREATLRKTLRLTLPEFMIPSVFIFLDELPKTLTGKIDRKALPTPDFTRLTQRTPNKLPSTLLEISLAGIWTKLLGIEQVGITDSFFELGGESLQAAMVMAEIEQKFNRKFPFAVLYQYDTIEKLAELLTSESVELPKEPLVPLQPLGEKSPVYFIPGVGGGLLSLHDLVTNMGIDHPIFGLRYEFFTQPSQQVKTIEQIAADYLKVIRSYQPHGPYYVAGYSYGGHITLEIGRQLLTLGEEVPMVALLDTYPSNTIHNRPLLNRLMIHMDNIRQLNGFHAYILYFIGRLRLIYFRLMAHQKTRFTDRLNIPIKSRIFASEIALAKYTPQPYPGKVVLFETTQKSKHITWDPMSRWKDIITGKMEVRKIAGDHSSFIKNPYACELARQLREYID